MFFILNFFFFFFTFAERDASTTLVFVAWILMTSNTVADELERNNRNDGSVKEREEAMAKNRSLSNDFDMSLNSVSLNCISQSKVDMFKWFTNIETTKKKKYIFALEYALKATYCVSNIEFIPRRPFGQNEVHTTFTYRNTYARLMLAHVIEKPKWCNHFFFRLVLFGISVDWVHRWWLPQKYWQTNDLYVEINIIIGCIENYCTLNMCISNIELCELFNCFLFFFFSFKLKNEWAQPQSTNNQTNIDRHTHSGKYRHMNKFNLNVDVIEGGRSGRYIEIN